VKGWLSALAWLCGGFIAFAAAVLVAWFGGLGPWGPFPGGILWGEVSSEPVVDWSFADRVSEVQVDPP
jgi:hypothetical protein